MVKVLYAGFVKMHVSIVLSLILDYMYTNNLFFPSV